METFLYSTFSNFFIFFILGTGRTSGTLISIDGKVLQFLMLLESIALVIVVPLLGIYDDKKGPLKLLRIGALISIIQGMLLTFFTRNTLFILFLLLFLY